MLLLTLTTAARNAAVKGVTDLVDVGTTDAAGDINGWSGGVGGTLLISVLLNNPAFEDESGGSAALDVTPALSGTAADTGTPNAFNIRDRDNTEVFQGTAGVGSGELNFDGTITSGQTVNITTGTYTQPAS